MKIVLYSDLHLEFKGGFSLPKDLDADLMILAGDIIVCDDYEPLCRFLRSWEKPVLYVMGNHEFYTRRPMCGEILDLEDWLGEYLPNVILLDNRSVYIEGVHFFGGTMWTDFNEGDSLAMVRAANNMSDYELIYLNKSKKRLSPLQTVIFHQVYKEKLINWFEKDPPGKRVVISHHAPVVHPHTKYGESLLTPAFNSLDMIPLIHKYAPAVWVYGHTHECDDQMVGTTRVLSNQLGYPQVKGIPFECGNFDPQGIGFVV